MILLVSEVWVGTEGMAEVSAVPEQGRARAWGSSASAEKRWGHLSESPPPPPISGSYRYPLRDEGNKDYGGITCTTSQIGVRAFRKEPWSPEGWVHLVAPVRRQSQRVKKGIRL